MGIPTTSEAAAALFKLAAPLCVSQVAQFALATVCIVFAGAMGVAQLGGAAMGLSLMNATGYAVGSGLCGSLETLLSHSYGANPESKKYGTHTQRMIFLLLILSLPLAALLCYIDLILSAMGQSQEIVFYTTSFVRVSVFGLVPMMQIEVQRRYFACQHMSKPVSVSVVAAAASLPLVIMVMLGPPFSFGFRGIAGGWVFVMCMMNVGLTGYLVMTGRYKQTWGGLNRDAFRHWGPMLKLGVPSFAMTFAEWITLEAVSVIGGINTPQDYAAFIISVQVIIFCWNIPAGIYSGVAVLVGNSIGSGNNLAAKKYATTSILVVGCIAVIDVVVVIVAGRRVARIFTNDEYVLLKYESMIPYFTSWHLVDTFQSNMLGIFRGAGMQHRGAWIIFLAMAIVGVPLSTAFCFELGFGVAGLWLGVFIGVVCFGLPLYVGTFLRTDWLALQPHGEDPAVIEADLEESEKK